MYCQQLIWEYGMEGKHLSYQNIIIRSCGKRLTEHLVTIYSSFHVQNIIAANKFLSYVYQTYLTMVVCVLAEGGVDSPTISKISSFCKIHFSENVYNNASYTKTNNKVILVTLRKDQRSKCF